MKRLLVRVALLGVVAAGIVAMAEVTQNRPDEAVPGSMTTVAFTVDAEDYQRGEPAAAIALWSVCASTVDGDVSPVPAPTYGHWEVTISPAVGEHGQNRLVGCIEDVTVDRVVADVVALQLHSP